MVKVLLLARLIPQSGNLTTAERIKFHLIESGNICDLQNTEYFENVEDLRNYVVENDICCVIGIHLWRAGKLLLDSPVPYSIIFGGTDLNEHARDSKKFHVMTQVAENARNLVAFSQIMACKAEEFWPDLKSNLIIQPQAVLTYPSQHFTEIDMINKLKACAKNCQLKKIVHGSQIIFLLVAGLRPVKDPMFLFKVFSDWHKDDPKVFLIVVGPEMDPAFSEKVKDSAKKYPGVAVMPALSQPDLHAAIKHCAVAVVNTSISEGMASSILEAMNLDTAVIARKIPGNECLIKHEENGLLFETPQEFLSVAKQVAYDEKYREQITFGGKEYISNNHSLSIERETYSSVVKTLMT